MAEHLPRSSRGQVPRRVLLLALLPAGLAACGADRGPQRFLARKAVLERQVVDTVEVDRDTGVLRCNVSFVGFELKRFDAYGESETGRLLIEELGRQGLDALKALAFPIAIPVRLEQEIALNRVAREGPVRLLPASLPLRLTVTDVAAHGRRLWIAVDVTARPPSKKAAGAPLAATPGAEER